MNPASKLFVAVSTVGVFVAVLHASEELAFVPSNSCNITNILSCSKVFASGYTSLFGIPFYAYGLAWFPLLLVLGVVAASRLWLFLALVMVGNLFTLYLWYLDILVIGAFCPVCVSLYAINYVLTGIVVFRLSAEG